MVSSIGSQVESAIFLRVIGSLGGNVDFGGDTDADGIEESGIREKDSGAGGMEGCSSGLEHTQPSAAEEAVPNN